MAEIIYSEWEDANKYSTYPFSDTSTFRTNANAVVLRYAFKDASIHIIGGKPPFYVKSITPLENGTSARITIATSNTLSAGNFIVSGVIDLDVNSDTVRLLDTYGRDSGILLLEENAKNDLIALANKTTLAFRATALEFVANVCVPLPDVGFRGFVLPDGTIISGSILLAGENGIVLNEDAGSIRIDVVGDQYYARNCLEDQNIPVPLMCALKTINGIAPDGNGDFKLTSGGFNASDTALRVTPTDGGLLIILLG